MHTQTVAAVSLIVFTLELSPALVLELLPLLTAAAPVVAAFFMLQCVQFGAWGWKERERGWERGKAYAAVSFK